MNNILVYRDRLTFLSERFILAQGEALRRYRAHYVGIRCEPAVPMPRERTTLLCGGGLLDRPKEIAFKTAGIVPAPFRALHRQHPCLLHAHFGPDGVRASPLARKLRIPLVVSFHGFDATMHDEALRAMSIRSMRNYPRGRRALQATASRFIAVSEFVRRKLVGQGFPEERIKVHYIGVDTRAFAVSTVRREPIILFVGRLVEQKGITDFVRMMARLCRTGVQVRGVVVGNGPAKEGAAQLTRELSAPIEFVGAQAQSDVRSWMQRSLVFCGPSRRMQTGWEEGFGLVFAESQSTGLPVVSYATGGIGEAVADGETGFLARDGDWRQLAAHAARLVTDTELHGSFSRNAAARTRRLFDLHSQTATLESTYDDVVSEALSVRHASNPTG
jgi:colanic acid/amylovoran biosynthesis glycosyltransferase